MEAINANAEYIYFKQGYQGSPTLVDMYNIKDIQYIGEGIAQPQPNFQDYYDKSKMVKIYRVIFTDQLAWQIPIDEEALKRWENFKSKHPVETTKN